MNRGRTDPRNVEPNSARSTGGTNSNELQAWNSRTTPRDWESVTSSLSERNRKKMAAAAHSMGDNFHGLGDFLFRPDLGADPDRGTGKPNRLPDERLYQSKSNGRATKTPPRTKAAGMRAKRGK